MYTSALFYSFKQEISFDIEELNNALEQDVFKPVGGQQVSSMGFVKPLGKYGSELAQKAPDSHLIWIKVRRDSKTLPSAAINDQLASAIEKIEKEESRAVKNKEKKEIKDNITMAMLPNLIPQPSYVDLCIDTKNMLVVIFVAKFSRAEECLALLRKSLGTLPVVPSFASYDLDNLLTNSLLEPESLGEIQLGHTVNLVEPSETDSKRNYINEEDITSEDILNSIHNGMRCKSVHLKLYESIELKFNNDGSMTSIKFSDALKEVNSDIPKEELASRLENDFVLFSSEIINFYSEIIKCMEVESVAV
jgi:recombination associated protein RdgC